MDRLQQIDLSSSFGDVKGSCEGGCDHAREGARGKGDFEFVQDRFSVGLLAVPCYDSLFDIFISHPVERYFREGNEAMDKHRQYQPFSVLHLLISSDNIK